MKNFKEMLKILANKGLKVNPDKTSQVGDQVERLISLLSKNEIHPLSMKVQGMPDMEIFQTQRQVREFIGMLNIYKIM